MRALAVPGMLVVAVLMLAPFKPAAAEDCASVTAYVGQLRENLRIFESREIRLRSSWSQELYRFRTLQSQMQRIGCFTRNYPVRCERDLVVLKRLHRSSDQKLRNLLSAEEEIKKVKRLIDQQKWAIRNCQTTVTTIPAAPPASTPPTASAQPALGCGADGFRKKSDQAILDHNLSVTKVESLGACKSLCLGTRDCKSIDFLRQHRSCVLSDKNEADVTAGRAAWANRKPGGKWPYDYYERC